MEFDQDNTPYLRLPPPHTSITLTTYRPIDAPILISMLNDPSVSKNLAGPPFPYLQTHHDSKVEKLQRDKTTALSELRELSAHRGHRGGWVSAVPFTVIRDETRVVDGEATAIGDLVVRRSDFFDVDDESEREVLKARNDGLKPGDPDIVWEIGFSLIPEVHGKGIMTAVLDVLTRKWLVPYMNVHHLSASYLEHNGASRRVFEKCGWQFVKFERERIEMPEAIMGERGKKVGMGVMKWERSLALEPAMVGRNEGFGA